MSRIGQTKCQPNQDECERVLAVLTEVGVWPEAGRTQCRECHGGSEEPRKYSQDGCHRDEIILTRTCDARVVNEAVRVTRKNGYWFCFAIKFTQIA
jgi:hypothetical protein